jgi:F0F1-type ATP synthase beta subunit
MNDVEITDFINEHIEIIDKNLRRDIAVSIENYIVQNDLIDDIKNAIPVKMNKKGEIVDIAGNVIDFRDENESEEDSEESEEEEKSKKQLVITKKNGKTRVVINL